MSVISETLEVGYATLEIEIEYNYTPGYAADLWSHHGPTPGEPAAAELVGVHVTDMDGRSRDGSWMWKTLDKSAFREVEKNWDQFEEQCIEASERV